MPLQKLSIVLAISLMSTQSVLACGDSLYRAGKGVSYRTYSAPLPGNLLVFGTYDGARQLAEELARSGHVVHVVDSADELTTELAAGSYDVVIAPFSERQAVENSASSSRFLPVATTAPEKKLASQTYGSVMSPEKHEIKHYLKAIHRALKDNS